MNALVEQDMQENSRLYRFLSLRGPTTISTPLSLPQGNHQHSNHQEPTRYISDANLTPIRRTAYWRALS
jgi:hypothetical protein